MYPKVSMAALRISYYWLLVLCAMFGIKSFHSPCGSSMVHIVEMASAAALWGRDSLDMSVLSKEFLMLYLVY